MLLAVSALTTLSCSSGGAPCPNGTHVYGFCGPADAQAATDAAQGPDAYPGFYGFWDASIDATPNDAEPSDASDASDAREE